MTAGGRILSRETCPVPVVFACPAVNADRPGRPVLNSGHFGFDIVPLGFLRSAVDSIAFIGELASQIAYVARITRESSPVLHKTKPISSRVKPSQSPLSQIVTSIFRSRPRRRNKPCAKLSWCNSAGVILPGQRLATRPE